MSLPDLGSSSQAQFAIPTPTHIFPVLCKLTLRRDGYIDTNKTFAAWTAVVPRSVNGPLDELVRLRDATCPGMLVLARNPHPGGSPFIVGAHPAIMEPALFALGCADTATSDSPLVTILRELAISVDERILAHIDGTRAPEGWTRENPGRDWAWGGSLVHKNTYERGLTISHFSTHFGLPWTEFQASDDAPEDAARPTVGASRKVLGAYIAWAQAQHAATLDGMNAANLKPKAWVVAMFQRISKATGVDIKAFRDPKGLKVGMHRDRSTKID